MPLDGYYVAKYSITFHLRDSEPHKGGNALVRYFLKQDVTSHPFSFVPCKFGAITHIFNKTKASTIHCYSILYPQVLHAHIYVDQTDIQRATNINITKERSVHTAHPRNERKPTPIKQTVVSLRILFSHRMISSDYADSVNL